MGVWTRKLTSDDLPSTSGASGQQDRDRDIRARSLRSAGPPATRHHLRPACLRDARQGWGPGLAPHGQGEAAAAPHLTLGRQGGGGQRGGWCRRGAGGRSGCGRGRIRCCSRGRGGRRGNGSRRGSGASGGATCKVGTHRKGRGRKKKSSPDRVHAGAWAGGEWVRGHGKKQPTATAAERTPNTG